MKKFNKVIALGLTAAMSLSMVACGSEGTTTESKTAETTTAGTTAAETTAAAETTVAETTAAAEDFDYGSGEIKIWAAEEVQALTQELADKFIAEKGIDYTVVVEAVGEGDATSNMITDVEGGADIFGFAQDHRICMERNVWQR